MKTWTADISDTKQAAVEECVLQNQDNHDRAQEAPLSLDRKYIFIKHLFKMSMANCIQSNKDILTEDPFRNIQTLFGSVKLLCSPITCGCLNLWQTVKLPQLGCMLFRSWMGFQTLVILQGQAPDTPTLLEAFLLQEARSNSKKYRLTKACWENGSCLTWRHYGLLERSSEGRKVWSFFMLLHEYTQYLCWK